MKNKVKESSLIGPAEETPNHHLWLSNLDVIFGLVRLHVPIVFMYKPAEADGFNCKNFFRVELMKEALSKVLVPFYPVAGRYTRDANGRFQIECNGNGVLLVEAETDSTFEDLDHRTMLTEELKDLLIPNIHSSTHLSSVPLFVAKVTKFACGGVCVGIGFSHTQSDGFSALHLINSWASIARGLEIDTPPYTDRTMLKSRVPLNPKFHHVEYEIPPSMNTTNSENHTEFDTENQTDTEFETFHVNHDQIETLKAKTLKNKKKLQSTYKILAAHIWRCECKARGLSSDQETKLFISVDGRSRLNPPLPVGYYGNAIFQATPVALSGDLVSEPLINTVERINESIERMDDEYLRSAIDYLERVGNSVPSLLPSATQCPNITITSWLNLPFYDADFGWGKPLLIKGGTPWEGRGILNLTNNGSLSLDIFLNTNHMLPFKKLFYDLVEDK